MVINGEEIPAIMRITDGKNAKNDKYLILPPGITAEDVTKLAESIGAEITITQKGNIHHEQRKKNNDGHKNAGKY